MDRPDRGECRGRGGSGGGGSDGGSSNLYGGGGATTGVSPSTQMGSSGGDSCGDGSVGASPDGARRTVSRGGRTYEVTQMDDLHAENDATLLQ